MQNYLQCSVSGPLPDCSVRGPDAEAGGPLSSIVTISGRDKDLFRQSTDGGRAHFCALVTAVVEWDSEGL